MKICTTLKCMILAANITVMAQSASAQWSPIANAPYACDGAVSFTINGKLYFGGGIIAGGVSKKFYEYDPTANTWTQKASMNVSKAWALSFAVNGKGYVIGGDSAANFNVMSDVWMYDPSNDTWTKKANFAGGGRDGGFSVVINNIPYIGCGYDGAGQTNDVWKYDPAADSWAMVTQYPGGQVVFPIAFSINNKLYVGGGASSFTTEENEFHEYDITANKWTQKADLPGTKRQACVAYASATDGYVAGGHTSYTLTYKDVYKYTPLFDSWTPASPLPNDLSGWAIASTIGNTLYYGTGAKFIQGSSSLQVTESMYKYVLPAAITETDSEFGSVALYPNPANDVLMIDFSGSWARISVYDVTGKELLTHTASGGKISTLNIGSLIPGSYVLKLTTDAGSRYSHFTKQ